ncbi:MAG: hypothetical protein KC910_09930 [Candidatus Eremiobacteraeota bacterium]|nr:hypothetical protein [Candidatus Eremiobacteraeota bacterium]
MKVTRIATALIVSMLMGVTALASDGWEKDSRYNQLFNPATVKTLTGRILSVDRQAHLQAGMAPAVVAVLETEQGPVTVHVAPSWFAKYYRPQWNLQPGDEVEVTGSLVEFEGQPVLMASRGRKGDLSMVIRDQAGTPVWDIEATGF